MKKFFLLLFAFLLQLFPLYLQAFPISLEVFKPETGNWQLLSAGLVAEATREYTYDILNRPLKISRSDGETLQYIYDANGNRTQMKDPDGGTTSYIYDNLDQLINLTNPQGETTRFAYNSLFLRTRTDYPGSFYIEYFYDLNDRLTSQNILERLTYHLLRGWSYSYDRAGNRTQITQSGWGRVDTTNYSYDRLYRLTNITNPDSTTIAYAYDSVGNRLTETTPRGTTTYTYNSANQLLQSLSTIPDSPSTNYAYDSNGNLSQKTSSSGTTNYRFDYDNRLVNVTSPTGTSQFIYDGDGNRIQKTDTTGHSTQYIYDGLNTLIEQEGSTRTQYTNAPHLDEVLSRYTPSSPSTEYYYPDGLGSVSLILDNAGLATKSYTYDAWGNITSEIGTSPNARTYTSREEDRDIGLMYYRARYYDPSIGRFISQDPFSGGPDDARISYENNIYAKLYGAMTLYTAFRQAHRFNRYLYCQDNPINYVDPLGLIEWKKVAKATWGLVSNSLGMAASIGVGLIPEPTTITKVAAVIGAAKTGAGLQLNAHNFGDALFNDGKNQRSDSAFGEVAKAVAPNSKNAQKIADIADLGTDLTLSISVRKAIAGSLGKVTTMDKAGPTLERVFVKDPTDLGKTAQGFAAADLANKIISPIRKKHEK